VFKLRLEHERAFQLRLEHERAFQLRLEHERAFRLIFQVKGRDGQVLLPGRPQEQGLYSFHK